jgi:hypothetical protein
MAITNLSSRAFDKHVRRAKKAANDGPVFINEQGKPAYVLLTIETYQKLGLERGGTLSETPLLVKSPPSSRSKVSIVDLLGMPPGIEDVEIEFPRLDIKLRPADFD